MAVFYNQATLSYNGNTVNSNIVSGEIIESITATKTSVSDNYGRGDTVSYVISLVNSGTTDITGLTVTDNLGGYTLGNNTVYPLNYLEGSVKYYINGVLQPAPAVVEGLTLSFQNITVRAGGNTTIVYEATVNEFAPLETDSVITNTVTTSGGGIQEDITATDTITVRNEPELQISKSLSPASVSETGQLTYTFLIQNYGNAPADASDNVVVTDTFTPILSNISVTFNSVAWTEPTNYTYNEATGEFATVAGQITVPAATFTQNSETGAYTVTPGTAILVVTGTV